MQNYSAFFFFVSLLLASSETTVCSVSEDCGLLYKCTDGGCVHSSLTLSQPLEGLGSLLIFFMSALANSTGIGGGEIMVPLLILLFFFDTHSAIPLSLMIMLGGSFIKSALRIPRRHPSIDRPLIDYKIVSMALSPLLVGATSGVLINRIFPDWLILLLITALLFYLTIHISRRAAILLSQAKTSETTSEFEFKVVSTVEHETSYTVEEGIFPVKDVIITLGIYTFSLFCVVVRGDSFEPSIVGIEYCSAEYWTVIVGRALVLLAACVVLMRKNIKESERLEEIKHQFLYDVKWDGKKIAFLAGMSLIGGVGVGLMGIGGGGIMGPALLSLGVDQDVARATSGLMILLTCSVTLVQYMIAGMVNGQYALWFFCVAIAGASFGSAIIKRIAKKSRKNYAPVIALAAVLGITTLVTPTYVITVIANGLRRNNFQYGFQSPC